MASGLLATILATVRSRDAFLSHSRTNSCFTSSIHNYSSFGNLGLQGSGNAAKTIEFPSSLHDEINRCSDLAQAAVTTSRSACRLFLACRDNHQQIIIAVNLGLTPGARAEQDYLLGVELVDESPDDLGQNLQIGAFHQ
jgi:hypothetical protein